MESNFKKLIEHLLGNEFNNIVVTPIFDEAKLIRFDVTCEPKSGIKHADHDITIARTKIIDNLK